ncbi:hypothetical protein HNR60_003356 [Rhodopseudomonas rhenobacensis]|uniref:Transmembrane protein n=1 Tax=Rhodopseudomonas rhenobacensis TaxID=87461 RepID=A0A7W8DZZ6_9BRAD|nr:hypothetical protein [Rhodopseudomonas rhenobacensis]MBB5048588.1 hypothetical protein [Rhodopseudomonas rhenobacensis]
MKDWFAILAVALVVVIGSAAGLSGTLIFLLTFLIARYLLVARDIGFAQAWRQLSSGPQSNFLHGLKAIFADAEKLGKVATVATAVTAAWLVLPLADVVIVLAIALLWSVVELKRPRRARYPAAARHNGGFAGGPVLRVVPAAAAETAPQWSAAEVVAAAPPAVSELEVSELIAAAAPPMPQAEAITAAPGVTSTPNASDVLVVSAPTLMPTPAPSGQPDKPARQRLLRKPVRQRQPRQPKRQPRAIRPPEQPPRPALKLRPANPLQRRAARQQLPRLDRRPDPNRPPSKPPRVALRNDRPLRRALRLPTQRPHHPLRRRPKSHR